MADNDTVSSPAPRRPTVEQLRKELERLEKKRGMPTALRVILFLLVVILIGAVTFFCLLSGIGIRCRFQFVPECLICPD